MRDRPCWRSSPCSEPVESVLCLGAASLFSKAVQCWAAWLWFVLSTGLEPDSRLSYALGEENNAWPNSFPGSGIEDQLCRSSRNFVWWGLLQNKQYFYIRVVSTFFLIYIKIWAFVHCMDLLVISRRRKKDCPALGWLSLLLGAGNTMSHLPSPNGPEGRVGTLKH